LIRTSTHKGVKVYFSHTPYIANGVSLGAIRKADQHFTRALASTGCFIEAREDLVLDRKYFFNSILHLNAEGRAIRTQRLVKSIQDTILSGRCPQY
jgi:hypothetical protein